MAKLFGRKIDTKGQYRKIRESVMYQLCDQVASDSKRSLKGNKGSITAQGMTILRQALNSTLNSIALTHLETLMRAL